MRVLVLERGGPPGRAVRAVDAPEPRPGEVVAREGGVLEAVVTP
jgi:hypothetical protein